MTDVQKFTDWEDNMLSPSEAIDFFAELIHTGQAWTLQGMYGRQAIRYIEAGYISKDGKVLQYPE